MAKIKKISTESVRRTTLSEAAHQAIRRKIITGVLAPGSKLAVANLADSLNLSATPINEALAAMEREGLVTYAPHRGYFVRTVTPEDIQEIYLVRETFELLAVRTFLSPSKFLGYLRASPCAQSIRGAARK